jgi:diacylglycerol kinase (ATP)
MGAATRVLIIANPAAGTVTPELVWELVRVCRLRVRQVSVRWTTGPGDARAIATKVAESVPPAVASRALAFPSTATHAVPEAPRTVVVAVGGDGTVRDVAAGLASAWHGTTPMLIVPAGTTNSCYRTLFGDTPWQSTVELMLAAPSVRLLDLARVAGRLVFAGASTCEPTAFPGRVLVDGREIHSGLITQVAVSGAGRSELLPRAVPDDGLLDVCVRGTDSHDRGRQIRVERTDGQPLRLEHDGEPLPAGLGEYTFDVVPAAVPVLAAPAVALAA